MIGIGDYESRTQSQSQSQQQSQLQDLKGVCCDYKNMLKLFVNHLNYSFIYQTRKNKMVLLTKEQLNKDNNKYNSNFKIKWNENEIDTFVLNCKKIINKAISPDSLIFIISGRGNTDEYLIDSDGNNYQIIKILNEFNNTQQTFTKLKNKPKLFVFDLCQTGTKSNMKNNNINTSCDENDDAKQIELDKSTEMSNFCESNEKEQLLVDDNISLDEKEQSASDNNVFNSKSDEFLNFCIISKDMQDLSNFQIDGIEDGGYLIRSLKTTLARYINKQNKSIELCQMIKLLKHGTLELIINERKEWDSDYDPKQENNIALCQCKHCDTLYYAQRTTPAANQPIVKYNINMDKMVFFGETKTILTSKDISIVDSRPAESYWYHSCFANKNDKQLKRHSMCYVKYGELSKNINCGFGHSGNCIDIRFASSSLYVGDLRKDVTEAILFEVFNAIVPVAAIRVCRDSVTRQSLGYAYVNFHSPKDAQRALNTFNFTNIKGKQCRIMWSQRDPSLRRSNKGGVFVKNLDKSIDNKILYDTFSIFGNILSCKVATNEDGSSRGYGYVAYFDEASADKAIAGVSGMMIHNKVIQACHFTPRKERNLDTKFTTIYVKYIPPYCNESMCKEAIIKIVNDELKVENESQTNESQQSQQAQTEITHCKFWPNNGSACFNFKTHLQAKIAVKKLNGFDLTTIYPPPNNLPDRRNIDSNINDTWKRKRLFATRAVKKNTQINTNRQNVLYIKHLKVDVDDTRLKEMFEPFGEIKSAKVVRDEKGESRQFGFVAFKTAMAATTALHEMNLKQQGPIWNRLYVSRVPHQKR